MSFMTATLQEEGTFPSMITLLKRSRRASCRDGHFLKIWYEILSTGEGADDGFDFLITFLNSSSVTGVMSIAIPGLGVGNQCGLWNLWGLD